MDIRENVPLSLLTTFRTGGPLRFLLTIESTEEISAAVDFASKQGLPLIVLGHGSNMLAPDSGLQAVFLRLEMQTITSVINDTGVMLSAEAGVTWDTLVASAVENGWWGLENLSAIPGTVGAAVVQNIGAYGAAISERVVSVDVFDTKSRNIRTLTANECQFGYRTSVFKKEIDRYIIIRVALLLSSVPVPNLTYRDLSRAFKGMTEPSLTSIREAVKKIRQDKFPSLSDFGTAGSFFLNPILTEGVTEELSKRYPDMPLFPLPEGGVKIPLAWIFDRALSLKHERSGKAFLWEKQALVLTAEAGATSDDVIALASRIAHAVFDKTGIRITPEVRLFGGENKILSAE